MTPVTADIPLFALDIGDRAFKDVVLADVPVLYWRLGTNGLVDLSPVPTYNGTAAGGLSVGGVALPGLLSDQTGGLETDGATLFAGGYATSAFPWPSGQATIEALVQRTNQAADQVLFSGDGGLSAPSVALVSGADQVRFRVQDNGGTGATNQAVWSSAGIGTGAKHHVAVLIDKAAGTAELRVDGRSKGVITGLSLAYSTPGNFQLGALGAAHGSVLAATVDEVLIYSSLLAPERTFAHFQASSLRYKIPGTAEALVQVTYTDAAAQNRDHAEVGVQRGHDPTVVQRSYVTAAEMVTAGLAGAANTRPGAYDPAGGTATVRATLTIATLAVCQAVVKNIGRNRIRCRVQGNGTGPIFVRATVQRANGQFVPVSNGYMTLQGLGVWWDLDLGLAILEPVLSGVQQSTIQIEAYSATTGDTIDVNTIGLTPTDRYVRARAPQADPTTGALTAADAFNETAGALNGKTADAGGNWATSGIATDYQIDATNHWATRTVLDAYSLNGGRIAVLGGNATMTAIKLDVKLQSWFSGTGQLTFGILARYVDANNWLFFGFDYKSGFGGWHRIAVVKNKAGVATIISQASASVPSTQWVGLQLMVDTAGNFTGATVQPTSVVPGWCHGSGGTWWNAYIHTSGQDADLASGGVLASGKVGMYDISSLSATPGRFLDNLLAWAPTPVHVANSGLSLQVDHQAATRLDTGGFQGDPPQVDGRSFLRLPPGETHRITSKLRRADVEGLPDQGLTDATQVGVVVTPRVLLLG